LANDDTRATGRDGTTYRPSAEERGVAGAKEAPKAKKAAKPAPTPRVNVDALYIHHSKPVEIERAVAFGTLRYPNVPQIQVASWAALEKVLKGYGTIGTLILLTHGREGGIKLESWKDGKKAGDFLKTTGVQAKTVHFEGCKIMGSPEEGAMVADGLQATTAIGYNWWHFTGKHVFSLDRAPAGQKVQDDIAAWVKVNQDFMIRKADGSATQSETQTAIIADLEAAANGLVEKIKAAKKAKKKPPVAEKRLFIEWFWPTDKGKTFDPTLRPSRGELIQKTIDNKSDARLFAKADQEAVKAHEITVDVKKLI
jgi:hypothetical protein